MATGRERREQSIPNIGPFAAQGAPPVTIFISDPVAGANYSLNPSNKTAIKLPVPQPARSRRCRQEPPGGASGSSVSA